MNIIKIKSVANKGKVVQIVVILLSVGFAVKGVITVVNEAIDYTNAKLDSYAVERVKDRTLLPGSITTKVVEVPVVKQSDVKSDIDTAIKSQLK